MPRPDIYDFPEPLPRAATSLGGSEAAGPAMESSPGAGPVDDIATLHRAEVKAQLALRETTCSVVRIPVRLGGEFSTLLVWGRLSWWKRLWQRRQGKQPQQPGFQP